MLNQESMLSVVELKLILWRRFETVVGLNNNAHSPASYNGRLLVVKVSTYR